MTPLWLGLAIAVGAPAPKDKPAAELLVGEWVVEQTIRGGTPQGLAGCRWTFKTNGTWSLRDEDGKVVEEDRYTIGADPGAVDLHSKRPGVAVNLCRFKIEGDTLTLNVGWNQVPRPDALESPANSKCTLHVMKRVK